MTQKLEIAVAGSSERSAACLQALLADNSIQISWVLTPKPKPVGRTQTLTTNPLAALAQEKQCPTIEVNEKLDASVRTAIEQQKRPDILLVVDFGYWIPKWLLSVPSIAPINIHPSALPRWRGSSPGQFVLLHGDVDSAVSFIIMNELLDQGSIIAQLPFSVNQSWSMADYYKHSFAIVSSQLVDQLQRFAGGETTAVAQPLASPTIVASRLSKADSFVPWELVHKAVHAQEPIAFESNDLLGAVISNAWQESNNLQVTLERAIRAFNPWPRVWTQVLTKNGIKRLQILSAGLIENQCMPKQVTLEGKPANDWTVVQNLIL